METKKRRSVRFAKRAKVVIPVSLKFNATTVDATIHEISIIGARITMKPPQDCDIVNDCNLSFKIEDTSFNNLDCKVIWQKRTADYCIIGLKFKKMDLIKQDILKRYIEKL